MSFSPLSYFQDCRNYHPAHSASTWMDEHGMVGKTPWESSHGRVKSPSGVLPLAPCPLGGEEKLLLISHPNFNYISLNLELGCFSCPFSTRKISINLIFSPLRHMISLWRRGWASFWRLSVTSFVFHWNFFPMDVVAEPIPAAHGPWWPGSGPSSWVRPFSHPFCCIKTAPCHNLKPIKAILAIPSCSADEYLNTANSCSDVKSCFLGPSTLHSGHSVPLASSPKSFHGIIQAGKAFQSHGIPSQYSWDWTDFHHFFPNYCLYQEHPSPGAWAQPPFPRTLPARFTPGL